MCQLAGTSRFLYYWIWYYWIWQLSAPHQEETGLRDSIQRLALEHRHYGCPSTNLAVAGTYAASSVREGRYSFLGAGSEVEAAERRSCG
jgi:hypothetical protein